MSTSIAGQWSLRNDDVCTGPSVCAGCVKAGAAAGDGFGRDWRGCGLDLLFDISLSILDRECKDLQISPIFVTLFKKS